MKDVKLEQINHLITSLEKIHSVAIDDANLKEFIVQLKLLRTIIMDDNYIDSPKTDSYLEKLSNQIHLYLENNDINL